ncbi:MAG TPA: hypothetical protein VLZ55_12765 [Rhodanobacter sp.]|nr:hypothetical protein [Rhodanobacter sp.]
MLPFLSCFIILLCCIAPLAMCPMLLLAGAGAIGAVFCANAVPATMHRASAAVAEINFGEYIMMVSPLWTGSQAVSPGRLRVQHAKRALKNVHEWLRANPLRPGLGRRATYT